MVSFRLSVKVRPLRRPEIARQISFTEPVNVDGRPAQEVVTVRPGGGDQEFHCCTFRNCRLVYSGGKPPVFDTCSFDGFSLIFAAAAGDTLNFMRAMYHRGFETLIDTTVNSIRINSYPGQWGGTVPSEGSLVS
jgi:hypothetical protein